jgi:cell division septation protein DedD
MAPTYYVIELTARWLTVLLVALALVMVLAFVFGYGAAWSVLSDRPPGAETMVSELGATPTPTLVEVEITAVPEDSTTPEATRVAPTPTRRPPATPKPEPTARRSAERVEGFWVQIFASSRPAAIEKARGQLSDLGFAADHQRVETVQVAGGDELHKLRVGPFPDRESADRVAERMRAAGFPDAWIVAP